VLALLSSCQHPTMEHNLCSDCGKSFKTPTDLKKHVMVVHIKSPSEICPVCGDSFVHKYKLKNHMVSKHGFQKDFECDLCTDMRIVLLGSGGGIWILIGSSISVISNWSYKC
jgi:rRNA maturation protein Nop10